MAGIIMKYLHINNKYHRPKIAYVQMININLNITLNKQLKE